MYVKENIQISFLFFFVKMNKKRGKNRVFFVLKCKSKIEKRCSIYDKSRFGRGNDEIKGRFRCQVFFTVIQ